MTRVDRVLPAATGDLLLQAKRLHFADAALEARYREERLDAGLTRTRVMTAVAALLVAANGWIDARNLARTNPDFLEENLWLRFGVMAPAFLVMLASTALPGHRRRAEGVNTGGVVVACWANALILWHYALRFPAATFAGQILGSVGPILVLAVFALPLRFRAILAATGLTVGGIVAWFALTLGPAQAQGLSVLAVALPGMGGAAALLGWWRERGERTMFAQREQVRRLAGELENSNAELARVNAEQAEFMTIAAHDLRAPLAVVRGYAQLLRGGRLQEREAQARALGEIEAQSTRMLSLVNDYLGTQAAAGEGRTAGAGRVDLAASARAAVERHTLAAAGKGQTVSLSRADAAAWVRGDEELLAQVTDNFVTNALKFSPRGAAVRVEVVRTDEASVRLAVRDEGPGIARDEQAGLFRKFGRASTKPTAGEASHGLGLAVAKRLAEAMGGRVGCDSEPGRGATFWIELREVG